MGLRDSLMGKAKSPEKAGSGAAGTPEKISEEGGSSGGNGKAPEGSAAEDTEVLDDEPKNILIALVSQLRPGMDLARVSLPTFVLEPRSMLERIGDSLGHADLVFNTGQESDPSERFIQVLRYYLSGWHIKVPGVKKPYNPVLGEFFRCRYDYANGTCAYYIAEQVSHHPPISAFFYASPENNLEVCGELRPKSKFLGNSAATLMGGTSKLVFMDRLDDGEYVISMPNMYARGILFGKMVFELGDESTVENSKLGCSAQIEFKTKGYFSGSYNDIKGSLTLANGDHGEVSGSWSGVMNLKRTKHGEKEVLFDSNGAKPSPKLVAPESAQEEKESRRLWAKVTQAIKTKDMQGATDAKVAIEEAEREARSQRGGDDDHKPRFFELRGDDYRPLFKWPEKEYSSAEARLKALRAWIYPDGAEEAPKAKA